jgi:hypothetical protein
MYMYTNIIYETMFISLLIKWYRGHLQANSFAKYLAKGFGLYSAVASLEQRLFATQN